MEGKRERWDMVHVLFVCLGNICRSPMAEGVFRQMVARRVYRSKSRIDSAGTGAWHVGEKAHRGTRRVLAAQGIPYDGRARQIKNADLNMPQSYIVVMDESNLSDLRRAFGQQQTIYRLLDFATEHIERNVPDPYYNNNFDYVYELVADGCRGLLATIRSEQNI
jgi:protein-tyrosine phosphatase